MWQRLRQSLGSLHYDPARTSLAWLLAGINVAIVLLVVAGISASAIGLLRDLADEQGLARVQIAGATAREELRKLSEDTLTMTRELATRPTLRRLLLDRRTEAVDAFLRRSCQAAGLDACAVFQGSALYAKSGLELDWASIAIAASEQGESFMTIPTDLGLPVLGVAVPTSESVNPQAEPRVFALRLLNDRLAATLSERVGLPVRLLSYRAFSEAPIDAFTRLHSSGLSDGRFASERVDAFDVFAASFPVFASTGEAVVLLEVRLPSAELDTSVQRLIRRLLVTALVLGALAVLAGVILGQQVAGPVRALTNAAVRLGEGDFSTSIPTGGAAEVGTLSRTMEDMRRNLVELTSALRRREAEAQAVLGGIVEGVYAVDRSRNIRYLNPQAARLIGMRAEDAIGRFCGDVLRPCAENGVRPCESRCPILQARTSASAQATERLALQDGAPRTAVITSASMVDGLQVQVIRDETELEAVRRARDTVLANISHEFRTPLAAQLASIELLLEGLDRMSPQERRDIVQSLERGTQRLTQLIDNLLESVRIESGQLTIRHQNVVIAEVVEDARALIGSLLDQRHQQLDVSLPEDLHSVDGDELRLTQVLVNLIGNASKFAPEHSAIRIGGQQDQQMVSVWVEDEGPGTPEIDGGSIFNRFSRGPEQEPAPGGLGLGLWIVRSIVERHGGTISAARTPEGRTRFTFTLPAFQEAG